MPFADTPPPPPTDAAETHKALLALRARAEQRRYLATAATENQSVEEVQRLVQELQVHQIELEMQYEELLLAQADAQSVRAQFLDLYDFAPVGYCSLDHGGNITQFNLNAGQQLGAVRQRLVGRRFALFVAPVDRPRFGQFLAQVFSSDKTQSAEFLLQREDAMPFHAQLEGLLANTPTGPQCRLVLLDVTARRAAGAALAASESRFRRLFEESNDAVVLLQGHLFADCNEAALRLLGRHHKADIVGKPAWAYCPEYQPDGRRTIDLFRDNTATALRTGSQRCEAVMHKAGGEAIWVEAVLTPIELGGPAPLVHVLWRDVTAARAAQEALRLSQQRLQMALEASETGTFTWDLTSGLVHCDARFRAAFGHEAAPAVVPVESLMAAFHPADVDRVRAVTEEAAAHGTAMAMDYRVVWPDGQVRHVSSAGRVVSEEQGPPQAFAGVLRDVTSLYAAEEEVRESRERLQMALDASDSGVWAWEMATHQLLWDARAQAIFGRPHNPEPVSFDVLRNAVHPADVVALLAGLKRALTAHAPFDLEHRIVRPDGQVRYVLALGKVVFDERNQPQRLTGIMRDITPRREAENALRRQKDFTESLLENTIDGIVALDCEQRLTAWNAEAARYFGLEAAQVLGHPLFEVLPGLDEKSREAVATALAGEAVTCPNRPFPSRPGHYDAFLVPLPNEGDRRPNGVLIIIRDVTERDRLAEKATQERLRRQQEVLAAILNTQETERKRIAEALHNGLGQLLYATKLSLDGQRKMPASARSSIKLLDEAIRTTRTISFELTPGVLEDFGLGIALETLVKRTAPTGLSVALHLLGLEQRLPAQVEIAVYRVVQELLNNVMKHAQATEVHVHVARERSRLIVSVEDNGRGFDPAELAAQPLVGIGLSGVRNRVTLLGSELSIQSRLGRGTIVSFALRV